MNGKLVWVKDFYSHMTAALFLNGLAHYGIPEWVPLPAHAYRRQAAFELYCK